MKQLAFLVISTTPSLKNIAQISSHFFLTKSTQIYRFPYIYLTKHSIGRTYVLNSAINKHTLPITMTKSWEV